MQKLIKLFMLLLLFTHASIAQVDKKITCSNITKTTWQALVDLRFDFVHSMLNEEAKRQIDLTTLKDTWLNLELQFGKVKSTGNISVEDNSPFVLVTMPVVFEKAQMILKVNIDSNFLIAGFFIVPGGQEHAIPDYVKSLNFLEYKIPFGKAPFEMDGMLSAPRGQTKSPLVIILPGSGPQDKDGTLGATKIYKDIAWGLASKGVAAFRFDKRTQRHGLTLYGSAYQSKMTPELEYVEDALAIIGVLKKNPLIDTTQIYLLGHSQGGMMAPLIATKTKSLKGIILLAANARSMQELMLEQLDYLYELTGGNNIDVKIQFDAVKTQVRFAMRNDLKLTDPVDSFPSNTPPSYWMYLNAYNQLETIKKLTKERMLVLHGERDYQVTEKDFQLWKDALSSNPKASFMMFPNLNHMMIKGTGKSSPQEYKQPGNVAEELLDFVNQWIKQN